MAQLSAKDLGRPRLGVLRRRISEDQILSSIRRPHLIVDVPMLRNRKFLDEVGDAHQLTFRATATSSFV
jgi:hypothetical protein